MTVEKAYPIISLSQGDLVPCISEEAAATFSDVDMQRLAEKLRLTLREDPHFWLAVTLLCEQILSEREATESQPQPSQT